MWCHHLSSEHLATITVCEKTQINVKSKLTLITVLTHVSELIMDDSSGHNIPKKKIFVLDRVINDHEKKTKQVNHSDHFVNRIS